MKKMTIAKIAELSGVSRATVSRVLTNSQAVSKKTAEKVEKVIAQCNYRPSAMARGLATGKMNIVSLVVSDIRNPFYAELVWVISQSLRQKGYLVSLYNSGYEKESIHNYLTNLSNYGFCGLILADAQDDNAFRDLLQSISCPLILVNRDVGTNRPYDSITIDNRMGGYFAAKHLLEYGHRKIAMLKGPYFSSSSTARYEGFSMALREFEIEPDIRYIDEGDLSMASGEAFLEKMLAYQDPPTAIFAGNDLMAIGVMNAAKRHSIRIPEDISIVGFDDIPLVRSPLIQLTTVRHPYTEIGSLVAQKLVKRIQGDNSPKE